MKPLETAVVPLACSRYSLQDSEVTPSLSSTSCPQPMKNFPNMSNSQNLNVFCPALKTNEQNFKEGTVKSFYSLISVERGADNPLSLGDGLGWLWTGISLPHVKLGLQKFTRCYILDKHFYFFIYPNIL